MSFVVVPPPIVSVYQIWVFEGDDGGSRCGRHDTNACANGTTPIDGVVDDDSDNNDNPLIMILRAVVPYDVNHDLYQRNTFVVSC